LNLTYKPELDGLRAISILLVIISHAGFGNLIPGGLGVTVFFFVSGYLITSLLIDEMERKGEINLYKFYLRRFWRLLPPMFFFLILSVLLIIFINKHVKVTEILAAVFYMANYFKIFIHFDNLNGFPSPFNILWSLAIEEHFYIIFAPLLALTYKSKNYFKVIIAFLVIPLIIRVGAIFLEPSLLKDGGYNYSATETRIDSIAFGCFLAYIFASHQFNNLKKLLLNKYLCFSALLLLLATLLIRDLYFRETYRYSLQNLSLLVIVANIVYSESKLILRTKHALSAKWMVFIGKLSYSLYLQHWLALILACLFIGQKGIYPSWQLGYWTLTVLLSLISYFMIEKPTMRFRKKYGSNV